MSEIKVMNNDEIRDFCIKKDLKIFELEQKLQQKENIIKEVREWLYKTIFYFDFEKEVTSHTFELLYTAQGQELLSILDKGE